MHSIISLPLRSLATATLVALTLLPAAHGQAQNEATIPLLRNTWLEAHNFQSVRAKNEQPQVIFVGDSITNGWAGSGRQVWQERFAALPASNFGIGGDRTQHVLWRLQNGALDGISPKVAVVMIGTNNARVNSPQQIAEGVQAIVEEIGKRSPQTKVLLFGIFPRDEKPDGRLRAVVAKVNEKIKDLDDGEKVFYLDISDKFIAPDGFISPQIMPDFLHLSHEGYTIWAEAIEAKLKELL